MPPIDEVRKLTYKVVYATCNAGGYALFLSQCLDLPSYTGLIPSALLERNSYL